MLEGKKVRMWMWSHDWMSVQRLAASCIAMALAMGYELEPLKNATSNVLRKSRNMRPLL